jgi:V/A-type H+-transporting ATPase subunit E
MVTQAQELEAAILARAERLANEYRERAHRARDQILRDAADKLRLREQREEAIAKALGERTYRQQVQAEELRLQSHLDRMRWNLVQDVEHRLAERMRQHTEDQKVYLKTLTGLIANAAEAIEQPRIVIAANAQDSKLLQAHWSDITAALAEGSEATLSEEPIDTLAGVRVISDDGRIRVDNTFEGRMARLRLRIQQAILERLMPSGFDTGALFGGT